MEHHLKTAELLTYLMENRFSLGKFRFGLDPLFGLVPGFGNVATFLLSFYMVWIAMRMQLPQEKIQVMIRNIFTDFIIGVVPVIGQFGDFFYRANSKNLRILRDHAPHVIEATFLPR